MANVDITIRAIDQTKAGFASAQSGVKDVGDSAEIAAKKTAILSTVFTATTALIVDSYKSYSKLAESIRDLALVSGESAENTSRFVQVLDDYQLTADDATAAAKRMKENGLSPTVESLALLSDQFKAIKDPAERMAFVYDNLGKSGAKWVNALDQGGDALKRQAAAISENLILSDFEVKMYEVGRLAIDEKTDAIEGFKAKLGQSVGNVIAFAAAMERANEIQQENTVVIGGQKKSTIEYGDALEMAIAEQLSAADASTEYSDSLKEQEEAAKAAAEAAKIMTEANKGFLSLLGSMKSAEDSYQEKSKSLTEERTQLEKERADAIAAGWWEGSEKILEYDQKLEENKQKTIENADEFDLQNKRIMLGYIERQLTADGTLTDTELQWLLEKGVAWGIYSQTVIDETAKAIEEANKLTEAINTIPSERTFLMSVMVQGADAIGGLGAGFGEDLWGGGKALGGSVSAGTSYLVGEHGPERFTPSTNGTITPNSAGADSRIIALLETIAAKPAINEYILGQVVKESISQVIR